MRLMLAVLLILGVSGISGQANARDRNGGLTLHGSITCSEYLDAYSRSTLTGDNGYSGQHETWGAFNYIYGFLSAYNGYVENGIADIIEGMSANDVRRWTSSWCRDNSSESLHDALNELIQSRLSR